MVNIVFFNNFFYYKIKNTYRRCFNMTLISSVSISICYKNLNFKLLNVIPS